jgi:hypothetical protein
VNEIVFNVVAFQLGWLACVLGAGNGWPFLGPIVVVVWAGVYLARRPQPAREAIFLVTAAILGTAVDSALAASGVLTYQGQYVSWMAPVWISALWMNFATTINVSMKWLEARPILSGLLGAVAGPLAYYAGARLGAIDLAQPVVSLALLALVWTIALPGLFRLSHAIIPSD